MNKEKEEMLFRERQQILICIVAVVMIAGFVLCRYLPLQKKREILELAEASQELAVTRALSQQRKLPALKEQLLKLQSDVGNYELSVPADRSLGEFLHKIAGSIRWKKRILLLNSTLDFFRAKVNFNDKGIRDFLFSMFVKNKGKKLKSVLPIVSLFHLFGGRLYLSVLIPINSISKSSGAYLMNPFKKVSIPPIVEFTGSI